MRVNEAKKVLKDNGILWKDLFDLRPFESDKRDNVRQAAIRMVRYIYTGRRGDE